MLTICAQKIKMLFKINAINVLINYLNAIS